MSCGEGIQETLIRECAEEASIPEQLARMATPAGCVRYLYTASYILILYYYWWFFCMFLIVNSFYPIIVGKLS